MMFSNKKTCRLTWVTFAVACFFSSAVAQTIDSAHRKLERPSGSSVDRQYQIELLKRLQSLMKNRENSPTDKIEGLSSLQKSMMESVLKQFQNGESLPDMSDLPVDLLGKVMSDPKARQDARELLDRFRRERRMPESSGNSGAPLLPPSDRRLQGNRPNPTQDNGHSDTPGGRQRPRENRPPTSPANRSGQRRLNEPPGRNDSDASSDENSRSVPRPDKGPGDYPIRMPDEPESEFLDRYSEFLEREIRRQRQGDNAEPMDSPDVSSPSDGRGFSGQNTPPSQQQSNNSRAPLDRRTDGTELPPTISDLMNELGGLPDLPPTNPSGDAKPPFTDSTDPAIPPNASSPGARDRNDAEREELAIRKDEIQKELNRSGLKSTLQKIVREARQKIKDRQSAEVAGGSTSSGDSAAGGGSALEVPKDMEGAIVQSLDRFGKQALELLKDGKLKAPRPRKESSPKPSQPNLSDSAASAEPARPNPADSTWSKKASDSIADAITADDDATKSPSSSSESAAVSVGPVVEFSWVPFAILGCVALLALGVALRSGVIDVSAGPAASVSDSDSRLKTREDVVKAFHHLARKPEHDAQPWWTHQQFRQQFKENVPTKDEPIEALANLYEQARYLPEEASFNDQQLEEARTALRRCDS